MQDLAGAMALIAKIYALRLWQIKTARRYGDDIGLGDFYNVQLALVLTIYALANPVFCFTPPPSSSVSLIAD